MRLISYLSAILTQPIAALQLKNRHSLIDHSASGSMETAAETIF